jgi:membrane protein
VELGQQARERVPGADIGFEAFTRELQYGGGLLAGGLAYRLFLWLVPLGLVGAVAFSFWIEHDETSVEKAAEEFGIGAAAIASAENAVETSSTNRILLLVAGLVLLAWCSVFFVKALQITYALAWNVERPRMRRPLHAAGAFNGLVVGAAVGAVALAWLRQAVGLGALAGVLGTLAVSTALALLIMRLLPNRAERWRDLLPGALLLAVGTQLVHVAVVFYFAPKIERSSELYGVLGVSAVLLVWLYVLARLMTGAAFLNATVWERRYARME